MSWEMWTIAALVFCAGCGALLARLTGRIWIVKLSAAFAVAVFLACGLGAGVCEVKLTHIGGDASLGGIDERGHFVWRKGTRTYVTAEQFQRAARLETTMRRLGLCMFFALVAAASSLTMLQGRRPLGSSISA